MKRAIPTIVAASAAVSLAALVMSGAWLADDALRLCRICLNWVCFGGPELNPGDPILAFDQPLWVVLLGAAFASGRGVVAAITALQFVMLSGSWFLLWRCHRLSGARSWAGAAKLATIVAFLVAAAPFRHFVASGLEYALAFCLFALLALLLEGDWDGGPAAPVWPAPFVGSLVILARVDLVWALAPLAVGFVWHRRRAGVVGWGAFAAGLAAPALWCAYALLHFGTLISRRPEIDLVQGLPRRDILVHGALYLLNGLIRYPAGFVLPVLAVAGGICAVRSERKDPLPLMLASGALVYLAFCVWHGGDNVAGRMLCPFFFISALSLACGPAFRIRTYAFTAGFALVFFDLGKVFPERPNGAAVSRSEELFREWGITDDFARQHDGRHAPPRELAGLSAKEWKSRFASSGELVIAAEPGREGIRLGPGRAVRDWRSLGSERAELRGTLEATVRFKGAEPGVTEPVLSFGPPEDGTLLLAEHLPGSGLRFQIWKPGLVPVFSQSFPNFDSRIWHRLDVRYGAAAAGGDGKGRFVTMMDGILLKDFPGEARRYDFREIVAGWNVQNAPGCLLRFSGEIKDLRAAKEGVFASGRWPMTVGPRNLVEMRVRFSAVVNSSEPLLVTGRERAGDIVFCRRVGPGQALFGVEHWGQAPALGPVVEVDSTGYHVLQVALGPLFVHSAALLRPDCIRVTLDGRTVLETRQAPYPFSENEVSALDNPLAGSFCGRDFLGEKISVSVRSLDPLLKAAQRALEDNVGPVSMDLRFDGTSTGLGLGLLEVGVSGDGCIVYAKNEDDGHVRLYFDHWGYGGITGSRVEVDRTKPHHLTIRMPALEAAGTVPPADADLVRFELDGRVVLEGRSPGAPARRDIIHLCENALLSSNVGAPFDGTCLSVSRGTAGVSFSY